MLRSRASWVSIPTGPAPRTPGPLWQAFAHGAAGREMGGGRAKIDRLRDVAAATTMIRVEGSPA